eukprot:CAMPEP_0119104678 /NCGR_PEP_ID=MMETSP1180-20130426/2830_1 /TAXON_ID=3052 ORGANISM="Chlamydomonas cf sp, Strain CCMP681" /NCGR_SAMPLE_ID=MMETSP1180 /ASSEMBLY_ACC=CAM_ASM_000741 /LENGTH=237 /DNA_ID=CAMNT_0007089501 /DNA_START=47 /DNA_END=760 /DNA_ORIENTATION=-
MLAPSSCQLRHAGSKVHARSPKLQLPGRARVPAGVCTAVPRADAALTQPIKMAMMSAALAFTLASAGPASAMLSQKIGEFQGSGFIFKDTVEVTALTDPEIAGVSLYVSEFKRSIVDKLAKDFFNEPSQASLTCTITGPVVLRQGVPAKLGGSDGQELFSESKGLNLFKNKTLRIRRVFDAERKTVVYVAFSTRLTSASDDGGASSGRYRTSLCALRLPDSALAPPVAAPVPNASVN